MFKVREWQEMRAVQEGTELRDQGPRPLKDSELCQCLLVLR